MMVHKSSLIPGISKFIDENVLVHYDPTSAKRIIMAGAISLYLKQNEGMIDALVSNNVVTSLGVVHDKSMIDLEPLRNTFKREIEKAGFMRVSLPIVGDIDFTTEDVDALYKAIIDSAPQATQAPLPPSQPIPINNTGVY